MNSIDVPRLSHPPADIADLAELLQIGATTFLENQWPFEPGRNPAQVWLGHTKDHLHLYARIPDENVVCLANGPNQRMWELGDTFEMFFQGGSEFHYTELHVTPPNHRLQLRLPVNGGPGSSSFEENVLSDPTFESQAHIENGGWSLLASIRSSSIQFDEEPMPGREWKFSFSRYDYDTVPGDPVLSSTSPHAEVNFHRRHEWGTLRFLP